jgi:Flp pilus assembly protein TadG
MQRITRAFWKDRQGQVALIFALASPVLFGAVGYGLDISLFYKQKVQLQTAADASALNTVRELSLATGASDRLPALAASFAQGNLGELAPLAKVTAQQVPNEPAIRVDITLQATPVFGRLLGYESSEIKASATARLTGAQKICLVALDPTNNKALSLVKSARLTAGTCTVFINSNHPNGLSAKDNSMLTTGATCVAGGAEGSGKNFKPMPNLDCPAVPDPLGKRVAPNTAGCDYNDTKIESDRTIYPGVYCGGLKITKNAIVHASQGIYVIKGDKLIVDDHATLKGEYVGFYLAGSNAQLEFDKNTTISLTAPKDGVMSGLLFFEDRAASHGNKHKILSNNAHTLLGTLYFARGILFIDAEAPVSDKAAYTIIVANRIEIESGPELFLNTNYSASDIPVPQGLGPVSGAPRLER